MIHLLLLLSVLTQQPPLRDVNQLAREVQLTPQQVAGIKSFWHDCLQKETVGHVQVVGPSEDSGKTPPGTLYARVYSEAVPGRVDIDFDPIDGTIFTYFRVGVPEEPGIEGRTHKDAVPEEIAWKRALPILEHYGLSTARGQYALKMEDHVIRAEKGDLYGAFWRVERSLSSQGLPCRGSRILIDVSGSSGDVSLVMYSPVLIPGVPHQVLVSKEEAVERVEQWLRSTDLFKSRAPKVGGKSLEDVKEVIAFSHNPGFGPAEEDIKSDRSKSFYCWQVPYVYDVQNGREWMRDLWVRVDNSDVIGGF